MCAPVALVWLRPSDGRPSQLGRSVSTDQSALRGMTEKVTAALRDMSSRAGRRACLAAGTVALVLSQLAGVPYQHLALTAGDITAVDGTATIRSAAGTWTLFPRSDAVLCGPCAITRWLRVVDLAITKITTQVIADAIDEAEKVTGESPHLCQSIKKLDEATGAVPVFPPIDQWGAAVPVATADSAFRCPDGFGTPGR